MTRSHRAMRLKGVPHACEARVGMQRDYELISDLTHDRILKAYTAMQNRFAGMKPNCPVFTPIAQTITLFTLATTRPVHRFRPTRIVESTVSKHDK